jgi:peroxiredoxin
MNNELLTDYASKSTRFLNLFLDWIIVAAVSVLQIFILNGWHDSISKTNVIHL